MGKLLRSAVVIGVLVYLAPARQDAPTDKATPRQPVGAALTGAVDTLWQALPDSARKTVTDEAKRQILNEVRNNLQPEVGREPDKAASLPRTAHKRPDAAQPAR